MFMQMLYSIRDVHKAGIKEEEFSEVCTQSCGLDINTQKQLLFYFRVLLSTQTEEQKMG